MPEPCGLRPALRKYAAEHFNENLSGLFGRRFSNELFSGCTFRNVRGAEFAHCVMHECALEAEDIRDILGVTLTLDCHTFGGVRFSPAALDAILFLLTTTQGNDETRRKIAAAIAPERLEKFRRLFPRTE